MCGRLLLPVIAIIVVGGEHRAHADNQKLVQAREALAGVRYDEARPLLVEALREGTSSPGEVVEIYRLSASTATVLGEPELAEQFYKRWLALDPSAHLPESVAPKLREPFVAAQAYMDAHGRLSAKARWISSSTIEVVIDSDPLSMVAALALDVGAPLAPEPPRADRRRRFTLAGDQTLRGIVVLDEFGNHLREILPGEVGRYIEPITQTSDAEVSWVRDYRVWLVPAAVAGGVSVGFGLAARRAQSELEDIADNSSEHTVEDFNRVRDRRNARALVANVSFVATTAFVATAAVMYFIRPSATNAVVPTGSGVAFITLW
ncbi:MAG: tetratricopeptide repeat protein [Kofleriaceae bacterium]